MRGGEQTGRGMNRGSVVCGEGDKKLRTDSVGVRDEQGLSGEWSVVRGDKKLRTDSVGVRDEQGLSGDWSVGRGDERWGTVGVG